MRLIITIIFGLIFLTSFCQVTNSFSKNESNIYFHSIDSLVRYILYRENPIKIILDGDSFILDRLPDSFSERKVYKNNGKQRITNPKGSVWIIVHRLELDQGEVSIFTEIRKQRREGKTSWENGIGSYTFYYEYDPKDKSYKFLKMAKCPYLR